MARDIAIDIGAYETRIFVRGRGIVLIEPSLIAATPDGVTQRIGSEAAKLLRRSPGNMKRVYPFVKGIASNCDTLTEMLKYFLKRAVGKPIMKPDAVVCVPCGLSDRDEELIAAAVESVGIRRAYVTDSAFASAYGTGCDVFLPKSNLIVNIGAVSTDIALISLGSSMICRNVQLGGFTFDNAVASYIKKRYNLRVSAGVAETIKLNIGGACRFDELKELTVTGCTLNDGNLKEVTVNSDEIEEIFRAPVSRLADSICDMIDGIPIEHMSDINSNGIILTGGGSMLFGLPDVIANASGIAAHVAGDPENCAIVGAGKLINSLPDLPDDILSISKPRDDQKVLL